MTAIYLDTSALGRILLGEPAAPAVLHALGPFPQRVASRLLRVELRRLALRQRVLADAAELLETVALVPIDRAVLDRAETIDPPSLGTLDAIHLVTALRLAEEGVLDTIVTYDERLARAARHHGLSTLSPG